MTTDTSREAVEALIDTVRNKYGAFDHFHRELADAAAALLDERDRLAANRDAWVSDAMTSTTELEQRIRDLEAEVERLRALSAHWLDVVSAPTFESAVDAEARHYHDSACTYQVERDKLTAKLDAVKAYVSRLSISSDHPMEAWHRAQLLAILADTDEGNEQK